MAALQLDNVTRTLQDAAYVTVGLGIIAFQRAQVHRQEVGKAVEDRVKMLEERLAAVEEQVDAAVERIEAQLPAPVAEASRSARSTAKEVREQVRSQVRHLTG